VSAQRAVRYLVRGRVQGVGYRWFAMREGTRLNLKGYVRNLPDGSVEVCAQGQPASLAALEAALEKGPAGGRVAGVEKQELPHEVNLGNSFEIQ
jgi:acylphosphatase